MNIIETTSIPLIQQDQIIATEVNDGLVIIIASFVTKADALIQKMKRFKARFTK
jgi:hypothetical protein